MTNHDKLLAAFTAPDAVKKVWTIHTLATHIFGADEPAKIKATERLLHNSPLGFDITQFSDLKDEHNRAGKRLVIEQIVEKARKRRDLVLFAKCLPVNENLHILAINDARAGRRWIVLPDKGDDLSALENAFTLLLEHEQKDLFILPSGHFVAHCRALCRPPRTFDIISNEDGCVHCALEIYAHGRSDIDHTVNAAHKWNQTEHLTHLDRLEAESIHIIREVMAEAHNPVMLYSVGKDSAVMLHLARKAFYPTPPPFPLLHIDTRWKFQAMYDFRDYMAAESGMDLLVHINPEVIEKNINPFDHGSALHTEIAKTQGLKQALAHYKFDVAFGGARRDEEKSRAKERIFSFRTATHRWDPKKQRPEIWHHYNGRKNPGESIRIFPLSNWTELDIWQYIYREQIPIVPLYFAQTRPVIDRDGMLMMVDDDRLNLFPDEKIQIKKVRFRTLGCYPLTGAIESDADDLASIVLELLRAKTSERQGRAIDNDSAASMEKKKQEGYF